MINAPTNAALRHGYTAAGAVTATLAVVGVLQGDTSAIGTAVHQIGNGVASVVAGVGTLVGIASAAYAAYSGTRKSQIAEVASVPGTQVKIPEQDIANDLPSNVKGPADGPIR